MECFGTIFNCFVYYCCKVLHLDIRGCLDFRKKLQHAKGATGEKCKSKILQHLKLHHEIMHYIKRVEHEKNTIWALRNMKKKEIWKKCTRIVQYNPEIGKGSNFGGLLNTGNQKYY